jgi:thymidylate synthase (FAD)
MRFVTPKTYFVGYTIINGEGLNSYLEDTGQTDFLKSVEEARKEGLSDGEILCSFYAKLCYSSLVMGKNKNITKTRDIVDNLASVIDTGHGSVLEHCELNFVTTNCSRVFTHELVRHRVGTAFSQTSGRYVRTDEIGLVYDPILDPVKEEIQQAVEFLEQTYKKMEVKLDLANLKDFNIKKKLTSAMRRILPNGQSNEIGFSLNLRSLRHLISLRTSVHAEYEIRVVFNQVYDLLKLKYPAIFADAQEEEVGGLRQITFAHNKI